LSGLPKVALSEVAELTGGYAFKSRDYSNSGRFVLRTLNIGSDCSINKRDAVYIPEALCDQYGRFQLQAFDTLFVMVGATLGKVGLVREQDLPALLNQNMWRIRANPNVVDSRYLHYAFRIAVQGSSSWATGSARDFVRRDDYRRLQVAAPPLKTQRKIAAVLSAYDDLIENNNRRIKLLEEMAQRIYREWFVDFRYPGHEAVPLVDSELGQIPEGWNWKQLRDIATEVRISVDPSTIDPSTPYVGLEHMPERSIAISEWGRAESAGSRKSRFLVGDVLFGKIRPYFHKVSVPPVEGICSTDAIVIRNRVPGAYGLVLAIVSSDAFVSEAVQSSQGTKMPRANWRVLEKYPVAMPPQALLERFESFASDTVSLIHRMVTTNRNLRSTRDLLLPRLISGEIDVSDLDITLDKTAA